MNDILNERALWLAVLIQTTADFVGIKRENVHRRAAREWFQGNGDEVGGFVWTCQMLGIDEASYRRRMYKIARENPAKLRDMRLHESNAGYDEREPRPPAMHAAAVHRGIRLAECFPDGGAVVGR
jgi:hypothetical protein